MIVVATRTRLHLQPWDSRSTLCGCVLTDSRQVVGPMPELMRCRTCDRELKRGAKEWRRAARSA